MTTPADFGSLIPQLNDIESIRLVGRLVEFQRQWLDTQAAQFEEIKQALDKQERKLSGGSAGTPTMDIEKA